MNPVGSSPHQTAITLPSDTEIRIERLFDASRDLVFRTLTNPALISQWYGPRPLKTTVEEMDVRVGGKWRFLTQDPDGNEFGFSGEYLELDPPRRLVQTWVFEPYPDAESVETMELFPEGDCTRLVVLVRHKTKENRDGHYNSGMEEGLLDTYTRLDDLLARQP